MQPIDSITFTEALVGDTVGLPVSYSLDSGTYGAAWNEQAIRYQLSNKYYYGKVFDTPADKNNPDGPLLWPLKINLVKQACVKHANHLWGQYQRNQIITFNPVNRKKDIASAQERADNLKEYLRDVWRDNHALTMLPEAGRMYMKDGGIWFRVRYDEEQPNKVSIHTVSAEYMYPVWDPVNFDSLVRIHERFLIDTYVAEKIYGYQGRGRQGLVWYEETWDADNYTIRVDGEPARDAGGRPPSGPNPYKHPKTGKSYLPYVYIPRLRTATFYGDDLPHDLMGLQDEYNSRKADAGDATSQASHPTYWGRNLNRSTVDGPIMMQVGVVNDMGDTITSGQEPHVEEVSPPDLAAGIIQNNESLLNDVRDAASTSPIMYGADEGSQRSSLTLSMRALPTLSMVDQYRGSWGLGLQSVNELVILTALIYEVEGVNAVEQWLDVEVEAEFSPVLPRDREAIVQEQIALTSNQPRLRSRKRALELLPDVTDPEAELAEIEKEEEEERQLQQEQMRVQNQAQIGQQKQAQKLQVEGHKQSLQMAQEKHDQQLQLTKEKTAAQIEATRQRAAATPKARSTK